MSKSYYIEVEDWHVGFIVDADSPREALHYVESLIGFPFTGERVGVLCLDQDGEPTLATGADHSRPRRGAWEVERIDSCRIVRWRF